MHGLLRADFTRQRRLVGVYHALDYHRARVGERIATDLLGPGWIVQAESRGAAAPGIGREVDGLQINPKL